MQNDNSFHEMRQWFKRNNVKTVPKAQSDRGSKITLDTIINVISCLLLVLILVKLIINP